MSDRLVIGHRSEHPSPYSVCFIPDSGEPRTIGEFTTYDAAEAHVHQTAFEMGAEPVESSPFMFSLHPIDDPSNVLTHEWTPER